MITDDDKTIIESLLNESSEYNLNRLKEITSKYDNSPQITGCLCKESNRINYLNRFRDWYNNEIAND